MAVRLNPGTPGATMAPPADILYAVLPAGVLNMMPSAWMSVMCSSSTLSLVSSILLGRLHAMRSSFKASGK